MILRYLNITKLSRLLSAAIYMEGVLRSYYWGDKLINASDSISRRGRYAKCGLVIKCEDLLLALYEIKN